jgi:tetratricopeptide (TPR) repeat protein
LTLLFRGIGGFCVLGGLFGAFRTLVTGGTMTTYFVIFFLLGFGGLMATLVPRYFARAMYEVYLKVYPLSANAKDNASETENAKLRGDFFLLSAKEYKIAISEYSKAIERSPDQADLFKQRALAHLMESRWINQIPILNEDSPKLLAKACHDITTAIDKNPKDPEQYEMGIELCSAEQGWLLLGLAEKNHVQVLPISVGIIIQKTVIGISTPDLQNWLKQFTENRYEIDSVLRSLLKLNNQEIVSAVKKVFLL